VTGGGSGGPRTLGDFVPALRPPITDPARLDAVRRTHLVEGDGVGVEAFDRLTALAAALLDAPWAFLTAVDDTHSHWIGAAGLPDGAPRGNTVEESFCQYVVDSGEPLILGDARTDARTRDNPSIASMGVVAWAGFPVRAPGGEVLGTFCVVDARPREWSPREVQVLGALADTARTEIHLRLALAESREAVVALERMQRASAALLGALSFDDIAEIALREAVEVLGARAANIALTDDEGTRFTAVRSIGFPPAVRRALQGMAIDDSLLSAEAARTRRPVWISGEEWARRFPQSAAIADEVGDEAAAVPLQAGDRLLGILGLVFDGRRARTAGERTLAHSLADQCAQAMERGRLYDREHRTAEVLQRSLLPGRLPAVPELEVAARYLPSDDGGRVGGDFYDLFPIEDGSWGAVIGDVCGKGPEAAAVTAQARHVIRADARSGRGPAQVLERLNTVLIEDGRSFLTAAHLRFRSGPDGLAGHLCLGGHPHPLALRAGGEVESLGVAGTLVGVLDEPRLREVPFALEPGDTLVLFTDGVSEARRDGEQLGAAGVARVLGECAGLDAEAIATRIEQAVRDHAGPVASDDIALLVMRRYR